MIEQTQETRERKQALYDDMNTELVTAVVKVQQLFRHHQDLADHPCISLDEAHTHHTQSTNLLQHLKLAHEKLEQQIADMAEPIELTRQDRLLEAKNTPTDHDQP